MGKFTLTIDTDNAAFSTASGTYQPGPELARILHKLADKVNDVAYGAYGHESDRVLDANGNTVGSAEYREPGNPSAGPR